MNKNISNCYCGSEKAFVECCEPFLKGQSYPSGAEALMRSRYSAFCIKDIPYLLRTLAPASRKEFDQSANEQWALNAEFLGLKILESREEGSQGFVKFEARFRMDGKEFLHKEDSVFICEKDIWYFVRGS